MNATNWRSRAWQYGLPTLLLLGASVLLALILQDPDAPVLIWAFVVAPVLTFVTGAIALPSRVWVTPAEMVVLAAILFLVLTALDILHPESVIGTLIILVIFVGLSLAAMTWLGRGVWLVISDWWQRRDPGETGRHSSGQLLS